MKGIRDFRIGGRPTSTIKYGIVGEEERNTARHIGQVNGNRKEVWNGAKSRTIQNDKNIIDLT